MCETKTKTENLVFILVIWMVSWMLSGYVIEVELIKDIKENGYVEGRFTEYSFTFYEKEK